MCSKQNIIEITAIKCLLLDKITKLLKDIVPIIIEFSFHNLYKANYLHQIHFSNVLDHIDFGCRRWTSNLNDHWSFTVIYNHPRSFVELQGINCSKCGQYQNAQSKIIAKISCICLEHMPSYLI